MIAKVNGDSNEVDGIHIEGFPTIMLFRKGKGNSGINYNGALNGKKLKGWLKKKLGGDWREPEQESEL